MPFTLHSKALYTPMYIEKCCINYHAFLNNLLISIVSYCLHPLEFVFGQVEIIKTSGVQTSYLVQGERVTPFF